MEPKRQGFKPPVQLASSTASLLFFLCISPVCKSNGTQIQHSVLRLCDFLGFSTSQSEGCCHENTADSHVSAASEAFIPTPLLLLPKPPKPPKTPKIFGSRPETHNGIIFNAEPPNPLALLCPLHWTTGGGLCFSWSLC